MNEIKNLDWYKLQAQILPQPLAYVMGRIARADGLCNQVDCIKRAAESLSRYIAIAQAASFSYRRDQELGKTLSETPSNNFSWGFFNSISKEISSIECEHPLKNIFVKGMGLKKKETISLINDLQ